MLVSLNFSLLEKEDRLRVVVFRLDVTHTIIFYHRHSNSIEPSKSKVKYFKAFINKQVIEDREHT